VRESHSQSGFANVLFDWKSGGGDVCLSLHRDLEDASWYCPRRHCH
jgi:hypothetical protein